ncbi:MAG: S4 domain-containing protein YaaA [Alicyclobacillus mali]|uniref:S4 domain-containing protein YaaA n=1 Tax=Alicyclobacillus mali (ex Roth et al. 2021) TaxID=1123961 RepID=UPI0008340047|nr:S4 domain-containing protein YaaA [Alicyclobacillus mali (ex Roth et al. 2021)]MCL6489662.1 S4 domain-containing protein YaaA [Alicyclobacillus mali (ex Roth et al. 2021)]
MDIQIHGEYITLGQLLKKAQIVASGGEVKSLLAEGRVLVNGAVETRRGRKLRDGDEVLVEGAAYRVVSEPDGHPPR